MLLTFCLHVFCKERIMDHDSHLILLFCDDVFFCVVCEKHEEVPCMHSSSMVQEWCQNTMNHNQLCIMHASSHLGRERILCFATGKGPSRRRAWRSFWEFLALLERNRYIQVCPVFCGRGVGIKSHKVHGNLHTTDQDDCGRRSIVDQSESIRGCAAICSYTKCEYGTLLHD